jgi:enoyl-CoA hydratase/carnithine racemase
MAINGPAEGFGITITLPATIRIACASAKISFAFARRGLVMEAASSYFLPRLVGMSRALHLVTTGATYTASDPLLSQLFSELLPTPEETVVRALAIAAEITAQTSTVSTKVMRDMMYRGPSTAEEAHLLDSKIFLEILRSMDSEEGMKSFMEKREPEFEGTMKDNAALEWWKPISVTPQESQVQKINKL